MKLPIIILLHFVSIQAANVPMVINTWSFCNATKKSWGILKNDGGAIDAVTEGCSVCEEEQCDFTVGFGGSPDESGETTLDAMIFDGTEMNVGSVAGLRNVKEAISVARDVLKHTSHSILIGEQAANFAANLGYNKVSLSTNYSRDVYDKWKHGSCQPNYWIDVRPNPKETCGPYHKKDTIGETDRPKLIMSHDTIGMVAIDNHGNIVTGTSSNGLIHKIPGRVGDAPIPGAGAYADSKVGGAAATGDGDVMMRFLPSFLAVEEMRNGRSPRKAAEIAILRIKNYYPNFFGAVIAVNKQGEYGAACNGMQTFPFCVADGTNELRQENVKCVPH